MGPSGLPAPTDSFPWPDLPPTEGARPATWRGRSEKELSRRGGTGDESSEPAARDQALCRSAPPGAGAAPEAARAPEQSNGLRVVIGHTPTLATLYAHLDHEVASPPVFPGQVVRRGQVIGYIGMSGLTTGPHLHFEVRTAGQSQDPRHYLPR